MEAFTPAHFDHVNTSGIPKLKFPRKVSGNLLGIFHPFATLILNNQPYKPVHFTCILRVLPLRNIYIISVYRVWESPCWPRAPLKAPTTGHLSIMTGPWRKMAWSDGSPFTCHVDVELTNYDYYGKNVESVETAWRSEGNVPLRSRRLWSSVVEAQEAAVFSDVSGIFTQENAHTRPMPREKKSNPWILPLITYPG